MSLLETILSAQGGNLVNNMAGANGIKPDEVLSVLGKLVPGLTQNLSQNAQQSGGLESLLAALQKKDHQRYLDHDQDAFSNSGIKDGNKILGHLLGNKDASRAMAGSVASETGIAGNLIKKMLPQVATLLMGALTKQNQSGGALGQLSGMLGGGQKKQATGLLTAFLDRDQDGSIIDDVMAMAARQFLR